MNDRPESDVPAVKPSPKPEVAEVKDRARRVYTSHLEGREARKSKRLQILESVLLGVGVGFLASIFTTCFIMVCGKPTPPELIVLNTVLGSTLTTIVGVVAGTAID